MHGGLEIYLFTNCLGTVAATMSTIVDWSRLSIVPMCHAPSTYVPKSGQFVMKLLPIRLRGEYAERNLCLGVAGWRMGLLEGAELKVRAAVALALVDVAGHAGLGLI